MQIYLCLTNSGFPIAKPDVTRSFSQAHRGVFRAACNLRAAAAKPPPTSIDPRTFHRTDNDDEDDYDRPSMFSLPHITLYHRVIPIHGWFSYRISQSVLVSFGAGWHDGLSPRRFH